MKSRVSRVSFVLITAAATAGAGLAACGGSDSTDGGGSVKDGTDAATATGADGAASTDATTGADGASSHDAGGSGDAGDGSTTAAADGASPSDSGTEAGASSCTAPGYHPTATMLVPGTVTATIHEPTEVPISGLAVSVTGIDLSYPGTTMASGAVAVDVTGSETDPSFLFGDGLTYGRFAAPVTSAGMALGTLHTIALPANGPALVPGTRATSGPLTLATAAGALIGIDTLAYSTAAQQQLRAVVMPLAQAALGTQPDLELVVATSPLQTTFCPPATATVANSGGWSAGTAVDFYLLGLDVGQGWAPFGGWAVIATGHVSSDGTSIVTDTGAGLPVLGTLGLKRH